MNTQQTIPASAPAFGLPESLARWSGSATNYPRNESIATLFEEIAERNAHRIALTSGATDLTYKELNTRATQVAHRLRGLGVRQETMVACLMDRSFDYIVTVLAILKAGGAYVPIDPMYPAARLNFLLQDTKAPLLLTNRGAAVKPSTNAQVLPISETDATTGEPNSTSQNALTTAAPTSLAYVMYTSGSTGQPKGVMVENRSVVRLVRNTNYCHFGPDETILQLAPLSFDASTFEIWGALLNGGRLVVMPPGAASSDAIADAIRDHRITTMWLTAPLFHVMVEQKAEALANLRQLLAGGDVLSPRHVRAFLEAAPNTVLINGYGPTENTTFTCCHVMRHGDSIEDPVPIGKPISNTRVYILDEQLTPVRPGESGELCAGGDGVARGYLNNPEATSAKFVPDPFSEEGGQRVYRTGDRARWRADGSIEFLGRVDSQVKILGHRVEPGEIESIILKHKGIDHACVVPHVDGSGHKRLVAYFVPSRDAAVSPQELRSVIAAELPQHMVPGLFIALEALPLSFNGKVDRIALSKRPLPAPEAAADRAVEATALESAISELWRSVLHREAVGLDDNFFDLGGDSLLLVSVHSRLQKHLNREISLTDLFGYPTVRGLARHLSNSEQRADFAKAQDSAQQQRQAFHRWRERRSAVDRE